MDKSQKIKQLLDKDSLNCKVRKSIEKKLEVIKDNKTVTK